MLSHKDIFIQRTLFFVFWMTGCFGFVSEEIFPPLQALLTPMNIFGDALILLLGVLTIRKAFDIVMLVAYGLLSFASTIIINDLGFMMWANGSRSMFGFLFLIPILKYIWSDRTRYVTFIQSLDKQLFIWLVIQAVCVTEQFLRYGAGDHGGGSMGNLNSGNVSIGIYFFSFYLLHKRLNPNAVFQSIKDNYWLVVLLFPTFLNETKISFILFVLYFVLLFPFNKAYVRRMALILPAAAILMGGALWAYTATVDKSDDFLDSNYMVESYLYADLDIDDMMQLTEYALEYENDLPDVPRFAKIGATPFIMEDNGNHWWVGNGMGLFNGSNQMAMNKLMRDYNWYVIGTNPQIIIIIVQLGILGLLWHIAFFWHVYSTPKGMHRDNNTIFFSIATLAIIMVYGNLFILINFCMIFFFFTFFAYRRRDVTREEELPQPSKHNETA